MEQKVITPSQCTWLAQLMAYDYEILYKKGRENKIVDALSRFPGQDLSCMALSSISHVLYQQVLHSYENDLGIQKIIGELQ